MHILLQKHLILISRMRFFQIKIISSFLSNLKTGKNRFLPYRLAILRKPEQEINQSRKLNPASAP